MWREEILYASSKGLLQPKNAVEMESCCVGEKRVMRSDDVCRDLETTEEVEVNAFYTE